MNIPYQEFPRNGICGNSAKSFERFHMKKSHSLSVTERRSDSGTHSPGGQVESGAEAAEDLDLGLGPEAADGGADAPDHRQPRRVLLRRRNHELEKVLDLLVQPATKKCSQWIMCPIVGLVNSGRLQNFRISSLLSA